MSFKYNKLLGRIKEKCGTQQAFAEKMGLSLQTINAKLSGKVNWKQDEILKACDILDIETRDIPVYFFDVEFGKSILKEETQCHNPQYQSVSRR